LPNEFLQNNEFSVDTTIVNKISKTLHVSVSSLPRHNSSADLPSELPAELLSAPPWHTDPWVDRLLLGVTEFSLHKNFLKVRNYEKKNTKSPKSMEKCEGSMV
jgi:hypothetical protein